MNAVRLATATAFVEGPSVILEPARRVENGIVLFQTALAALLTQPTAAEGQGAAGYLKIAREQREGVRKALRDFASAARIALDGEDVVQDGPVEPEPPEESAEELSWLCAAMASVLCVAEEDIDPDDTVSAHGLDSVMAVGLVHHLGREHGLDLGAAWFFEVWDQTVRQVSGRLAAIRVADT